MYKSIDKLQHSFLGFSQPMGLHINLENRWIKLADRVLLYLFRFWDRYKQYELQMFA